MFEGHRMHNRNYGCDRGGNDRRLRILPKCPIANRKIRENRETRGPLVQAVFALRVKWYDNIRPFL